MGKTIHHCSCSYCFLRNLLEMFILFQMRNCLLFIPEHFLLQTFTFSLRSQEKWGGRNKVPEVSPVLKSRGGGNVWFFIVYWPAVAFTSEKTSIFSYKIPFNKTPFPNRSRQRIFAPALSSMDLAKPTRFPNNYKTPDRCQIINKERCTQSNYCTPILKDTVPILQNNAAFSKKMPLSLLTTGT